MSLDKDTVARIARLARLKVPEEELAPLAGELLGIFAWIEQLNEVDTNNIEPMSSVSDVTLPAGKRRITRLLVAPSTQLLMRARTISGSLENGTCSSRAMRSW